MLNNLGLLALDLGDSVAARELVEDALGDARASGDLRTIGFVSGSLAHIEFDVQDHRRAREHWTDCLTIARDLSDLWLACSSLEGIARLRNAENDVERGVELVGAGVELALRSGSEISADKAIALALTTGSFAPSAETSTL